VKHFQSGDGPDLSNVMKGHSSDYITTQLNGNYMYHVLLHSVTRYIIHRLFIGLDDRGSRV
jgi:hypothetical protein